MTTKNDLLDIHRKELELAINKIRLIIKHNATKGFEAEFAFRKFLEKYLPKKYKIGSGFVFNEDAMSKQHDIIIYDDLMNAPMFLGGSAGAFPGGAVYGVIETTLVSLGKNKLEDDISKMGHLRKLFPGNKVNFQRITSRPLVDENQIKNDLSGIQDELSSGTTIDGLWDLFQEECIQDGVFIKHPDLVDWYDDAAKQFFNEKYSESKKFVVHEEIVKASPPPRTYLCALDGSSYGSIQTLAEDVKELTIKHGSHIHGLLVLNKEDERPNWLVATKAFSDYEVEVFEDDALLRFIEGMGRSFQAMRVGKLPAK